MNGSPSSVLTLGMGSWGSVNLMTTLGFGVGAAAVIVTGPYRVDAQQVYTPGSVASQVRSPGMVVGQAR